MNKLQASPSDQLSQALNHAIATLGPATFTVTDTALIVAVGPSRLIMTAEGIILDAPRIDLNLDGPHE
jgi:hypothetical protein